MVAAVLNTANHAETFLYGPLIALLVRDLKKIAIDFRFSILIFSLSFAPCLRLHDRCSGLTSGP
jgi:hypothetical protein